MLNMLQKTFIQTSNLTFTLNFNLSENEKKNSGMIRMRQLITLVLKAIPLVSGMYHYLQTEWNRRDRCANIRKLHFISEHCEVDLYRKQVETSID